MPALAGASYRRLIEIDFFIDFIAANLVIAAGNLLRYKGC